MGLLDKLGIPGIDPKQRERLRDGPKAELPGLFPSVQDTGTSPLVLAILGCHLSNFPPNGTKSSWERIVFL